MYLLFLNVMLNWVDVKMKYDEVCIFFLSVFLYLKYVVCVFILGVLVI